MAVQVQGRSPRRDAQRNMERVLEAARHLFAARGSDVTMEEIASYAGVGIGTIYRHFPNKGQLLQAICHDACSHMHHCFTTATQATGDPLGQLRALFLIQYHASHPALLVDWRAALHGSPDDDIAHLYGSLHRLLVQVIHRGQQQGVIRAGDPQVLAAFCLELLSPQTRSHIQQVVGGRAESIANDAVDFVIGGLIAH